MGGLHVTSGDAYLNGGVLGDRRLVLTVRDPDGALLDLTGVDLTFMVKRFASDDDAAALITKVTPSQIALKASQSTTGKGIAYLSLLAADTSALSGRFPWELEAVDAVGSVTLASGYFYVAADLIEGA